MLENLQLLSIPGFKFSTEKLPKAPILNIFILKVR